MLAVRWSGWQRACAAVSRPGGRAGGRRTGRAARPARRRAAASPQRGERVGVERHSSLVGAVEQVAQTGLELLVAELLGRAAPSRKPSGSSRSAAVGSRWGLIQTPSRASAPCRVRSEPHSVEASRSRRGRSSRPTSDAKVCSAGPPEARRRRTASWSLVGGRHPLVGRLADDLVDPALDQREGHLEPLQRRLPARGSAPWSNMPPSVSCCSDSGLVRSRPRICSSMEDCRLAVLISRPRA